ncbi:MAG TPA: amino acid racemase [Terriglobales bacterium]|nr:amino acid racemase [Terriglobales bacterium]
MKILGIIGGIGPEATIDYYKSLITIHRKQYPEADPPSILINSINMKRVVELVTANRLQELVSLFVEEIQTLANARADFGLIAANTPHIVFDEVARASPIPLISIVEATRDHAEKLGFSRIGLLGTRFTMKASFFPTVFARKNIEIRVPNNDDQDYVHEKYFRELVNGILLEETRAELLNVIQRMKDRDEVEAVILGGTELPLILRDADAGIPFLDTTQIHVRAALERMKQ